MKQRHSLPAEVYALVEQTPATVLLEGGRPSGTKNQCERNEEPWTQLFTAPLRVCAASIPAEIPALFAEIETAVQAGLFAAGFFSYECGTAFEPKMQMHKSPEGSPLAWFGIYDRSYPFDHQTGTFPDGLPPGLERLPQTKIPCQGTTSVVPQTQPKTRGALAPEEFISAEFALSEADYSSRIAQIHEWIRAGDVYQLNFTAPWRIKTSASAAELYARLRARQPVEYGAFVHWLPGLRILSFSPELFFRTQEEDGARRIWTRPMKGTAPRGHTAREDRSQAEWLRQDAKNRAENLMIVDLERNDLGRLARFGTVRVQDLFTVERLPTLWQMTSTVTAMLRDEVSFHHIFRALFPCGSITGAPKIRATQLIAEIEDQPRGVYTGAIGFFSPRQTVFNVAIRTLEMNGDQGTMGAGSGIVIDSNAAEEYRECLLKAEFLTQPSDRLPAEFSLVETMLWNGRFPLLQLHLDRLAGSAEYFGFACERDAVESTLDQFARAFTSGAARKVRLLLDRQGGLTITDEKLASGGDERVGRVRMARTQTDPDDAMLFHKTTHRPIYAEALKQAAQEGFCDVLFLNLRGELTEGAISNVFVEKDGHLLTPPVECGLLAGVYRRHLLEMRPDIEERILHEEDLRTADAVYLANAVRGLRRVELEGENAGPSLTPET